MLPSCTFPLSSLNVPPGGSPFARATAPSEIEPRSSSARWKRSSREETPNELGDTYTMALHHLQVFGATADNGLLLIMDEVVTFRLAPGGAQIYYGDEVARPLVEPFHVALHLLQHLFQLLHLRNPVRGEEALATGLAGLFVVIALIAAAPDGETDQGHFNQLFEGVEASLPFLQALIEIGHVEVMVGSVDLVRSLRPDVVEHIGELHRLICQSPDPTLHRVAGDCQHVAPELLQLGLEELLQAQSASSDQSKGHDSEGEEQGYEQGEHDEDDEGQRGTDPQIVARSIATSTHDQEIGLVRERSHESG